MVFFRIAKTTDRVTYRPIVLYIYNYLVHELWPSFEAYVVDEEHRPKLTQPVSAIA